MAKITNEIINASSIEGDNSGWLQVCLQLRVWHIQATIREVSQHVINMLPVLIFQVPLQYIQVNCVARKARILP